MSAWRIKGGPAHISFNPMAVPGVAPARADTNSPSASTSARRAACNLRSASANRGAVLTGNLLRPR
jgi:hypothetical protein